MERRRDALYRRASRPDRPGFAGQRDCGHEVGPDRLHDDVNRGDRVHDRPRPVQCVASPTDARRP
jgi:hypothetical protein